MSSKRLFQASIAPPVPDTDDVFSLCLDIISDLDIDEIDHLTVNLVLPLTLDQFLVAASEDLSCS